mgnify:CR=1 FL=1
MIGDPSARVTRRDLLIALGTTTAVLSVERMSASASDVEECDYDTTCWPTGFGECGYGAGGFGGMETDLRDYGTGGFGIGGYGE